MRGIDMNSDEAVGRALRALADADEARHAPPHAESALLDAFDRQRARASASRSAWRTMVAWRAVVATIVVVPLAIAVYRRVLDPLDVSPPPPLEPYTMSSRSEHPRSSLADQIDSRTATEIAPPVVPTRAQPIAASNVRGSQPAPRQVVSTNRGEVIGQTMQLRLPRSALVLFGIPVIAPEVEGTVNVELVLSEDGQARAIRIVQ
jgi:hypothetical protein